jgi:hypothetical protein
VALILIAGFAATYYLGWLPGSFVVPALFALGFLARAPRKQARTYTGPEYITELTRRGWLSQSEGEALGRHPRFGGNGKQPASPTLSPGGIHAQWETATTGFSNSLGLPGPVSEAEVTPPTRAQLSRLTELGWFGDATGDLGASGARLGDAA